MLSYEASNYIAKKGINQGRVILHSDLNNFFASVECLKYKAYKNYPIAVCGNAEERHGIVLAKNNLAKKFGIVTGQTVWQAKKLCQNLIVIEPNYEEYLYYSKAVRRIYSDYSDRVEPFGLDEAWIDLTGTQSAYSLADGIKTANSIRKRIYEETGLTVSIGVSDNKTFSKLASDYKKPDAVTVFGPDEYIGTVSGLAVGEIMYAGRMSRQRLKSAQIETIADVAEKNPEILRKLLGKNGEKLYFNACGYDFSEVLKSDENCLIKSLGNSATPPRDLCGEDDIKLMIAAVCDKVCSRMRKAGMLASTLQIHVRNSKLKVFERQCAIVPSDSENDIATAAVKLYEELFPYEEKIRSLGIRVSGLIDTRQKFQASMFSIPAEKISNQNTIDVTVDELREKYGRNIIKRGILYTDEALCSNLYGGKRLTSPFKSHGD